jgi:hypothetical protein
MQSELKSLRSMRTMPLPDEPIAVGYGWEYVGAAHDVRLFPAAIRTKETIRAEAVMEGGQSTCFFHSKLPATGICDVSGRMICDLCKTEFEGRTVSFEALQTLVGKAGKDGKVKKAQGRTKWDDIALTLVVLPVLIGPLMVFTAPVALGICLVKWREGPTSVLRRSRWRYVVAGFLALLQIVGGGMLVYNLFFGTL